MASEGDVDHEKIKIERIKQRYQLASVALGTTLVSIVGAWLVFSENTQKNTYDFDAEHRDFASEFLDLAISENIHERIRLARYFSFVTIDDKQRGLWGDYAVYLEELRDREFAIAEELEAAAAAKNDDEIRKLEQESEALRQQLGESNTSGMSDSEFQEIVERDVSDPSSALTAGAKECNGAHDAFSDRWLCIARKELDVVEVPGSRHNPRIIGYFSYSGASWFDDDETPWATAFVSWVVAQSGYQPLLPPAKSLSSRAWEDFGVEAKMPRPGDIVLIWRRSPSSGAGHVGFYLDETESEILILGGNQGNAVRESWFDKERLLSIRTAE